MASIDDLIKLYRDTFGDEELIVISDNVKVFKNAEGRRLIFDEDSRMIHSIAVNTDGSNFGVQNLFQFESLMYDQVQFMNNYGGGKELSVLLDKLKEINVIDEDKRLELVNYFKSRFAFVDGYGNKPYEDVNDKDRSYIDKERIPTNDDGEILTSKDTLSINKIRH